MDAELWNSRFTILVAALIVLCVRDWLFARDPVGWGAAFNLVGTAAHELCHLVVGFALGAHPCGVSLRPRKSLSGSVLGEVAFTRLNALNRFPTACAPLLLLLLAYWLDRQFPLYSQMSLLGSAAHSTVMTLLLVNALPSPHDIKIAFSSQRGALTWLVAIGIFFV